MTETNQGSRNIASHFLICVDRAEGGILSGVCYNSFTESPIPFLGMENLLFQMDEISNQVNYPHEYFEPRYFVEESPAGKPFNRQFNMDQIKQSIQAFSRERGELATFKVDILFRQNASWQGNISWQEQKMQKSFRSVLELMRMMISAVRFEGKSFCL